MSVGSLLLTRLWLLQITTAFTHSGTTATMRDHFKEPYSMNLIIYLNNFVTTIIETSLYMSHKLEQSHKQKIKQTKQSDCLSCDCTQQMLLKKNPHRVED